MGLPSSSSSRYAPRAAADRRDDGERRARHARRGRRGIPQPDEQVSAHVRFELQRLDVDGRDQHGLPVEAEVEVGERRERAHEESRADEQHHRQRDLDDDEQVAEREAVLSRDPAALGLHRVVGIDACRAQGGDGPEDHGRRDGDAGREPEHAPVEGHLQVHVVRGGRQLPHEQAAEPAGEDEAEHGAESREHEALAQELPRQPGARRAERQAHAQLVPPRRRAREQQVGDVGARDEQHEADDDHQRGERPLIASAQSGAARCRRVERERFLQVVLLVVLAPVLRHGGVAQLWLDAAQRGLRRLERLVGAQAAHHVQPPGRAAIERALLAANEGLGAERDGDVERAADVDAKEPGRRDADDRERHAFDDERPADDVSRAAEAPLPEGVADDRHRTIGAAPAPVIVFRPRAAEDGRDPKHVEVASARPDAVDELGRSALREVEPRARPGDGALEELRAIPDGFPDGVRPARPAVGQLAYHHEALRVLDRQGSQQQAVENREHRRVRADSKRQRQDRDGRDHRRRPHGPQRITNFVHARV